jgi:Protein of unknown function (DUF998)
MDYNLTVNIASIIAVCSFLAYLGAYSILLWLHVTPTEYRPLQHAVSDYGVGRTSRPFVLYLQLTNVGGIFLALTLMTGLKMLSVPHWPIVFLFLLVCARLGTSAFPTDLEGKPLTRTGILHYIFAICSVGFVYTIIAELTPFFQTIQEWSAVSGILGMLLTAITPILIMVVITMWKPLRNIFGLFERLFIATSAIWFLIVSASLIVLAH